MVRSLSYMVATDRYMEAVSMVASQANNITLRSTIVDMEISTILVPNFCHTNVNDFDLLLFYGFR